MQQGFIFDIQRFSPHDGPGIRTTVFLKGCPLRCSWCHNPESMRDDPQLLVRPGRCIKCGACIEACADGVATPANPPAGDCALCGACVDACPTQARELVGRSVGAADLVAELLRDRIFFDESGGGVTFSGGEPLAQPAFLTRCLEALRGEEVHTALDTCGYAPLEVALEAARLADLILYDVKVIDEARHRRLTGVSNGAILANLRELARRHDRIWLRVPVIPGFNDDEANLEATSRLAASLPAVTRVCLLPFHPTGARKYGQIGMNHSIPPIESPSRDRMQQLCRRFEAAGLETSIGG